MPGTASEGVEGRALGAKMGSDDEKMAKRTQFPAVFELGGVALAAVAACSIWFVGGPSALAEDSELEPVVVVRAIHPERQAAAAIDLFAGSRAASPAAALAAWRRATGNHDAIGKTLQAVAALFNPEMVPEWRSLNGARFDLAVEGARPGALWSLVAPGDDGAIAAAITSLRLSGGVDEPPILNPPVAVERLGGPGAALAARLPGAAVFASERDMLAAAIRRFRAGRVDPAAPALFGPDDSGFSITVHPDRLAVDERVAPGLARLAMVLRTLGLVNADGRFGLEGDRLGLDFVSRFQSGGEGRAAGEHSPPLDPSWLAWFPERESAAAAAVVLGPGAGFWDRFFPLADAIDRAPSARAQLAPLRTRLTFLALARGVRLEADLWPLLRGASAGVLVEDGLMGRPRGVVVALHAADPQGARRILDRVVAPLASTAGAGKPKPEEEAGADPLALGRVSGRPLEAVARGSTVLVGWGEGALARALQSAEAVDESVAALLKKAEDGRPVNRFGAVQPGKAALAVGAWGPNSPFAAALVDGSPIVWRGGWSGRDGLAWDSAQWPALRGLVARFLERIPQEPFEAP